MTVNIVYFSFIITVQATDGTFNPTANVKIFVIVSMSIMAEC